MKEKGKYFYLYLFSVQFLGALCFYCGFFPSSTSSDQFSTMDEFPDIDDSHLDYFIAYKRHFRKCIIMVIDSLRYDFVDSGSNNTFFPYLTEKLNSENSCLLKAKVQSPTVTLPRIKSLITGSVPGFLDVVSNFGKSELFSDNFIVQANANGYKTVFYGDETWINLLPHAFERSKGTTSFFVSDYTEVDLNVTRNMELELHNDDWNIMILHYLGLDHIGHLEGPRSNLVRPKLLEMDAVISKINEHFISLKEYALIIICGDHGMKDSGGHGGTSLSETIVPIAILNYKCDPVDLSVIDQMDLAPLISVLLGIPIPYDSIGKLHYNVLTGINEQHALYAMYYNTFRLLQKIIKFNLNETNLNDFMNSYFNNAVKFYKSFLKTHSHSDYLNTAKYFSKLQEYLSDKLLTMNVNYDVILMIFGMILFLQSVLASIFGHGFLFKYPLKIIIFITSVIFSFHCTFCYLSFSNSATCSLFGSHIFCTFLIYFLLIFNLLGINYCRKFNLIYTPHYLYLIIGTLLHVISLTSSSFIEEEHQFWYFLIVTITILFIRKDFLGFGAILICHRFLRYLNQTGDKWASLPDIEDWLLENNVFYTLILYIFSLLTTCLINLKLHSFSSYFLCIFTVGQFVLIFLYKIISGSIKISDMETNQRGALVIARCFWTVTFLKLIILFKYLIDIRKSSFNKVIKESIDIILCLTLTTICFLYKPHNLLIIPSLLFYSFIYKRNLKFDTVSIIYFHYCLGSVFYFYQGNSNSISTIDVSSGYVGLENYNIFLTGLYISLNTFSSPILAFLLMLKVFASSGKLVSSMAEIFRMYTLIFGLQIIVYSKIMTLQRHHLFIWSVFAPKLLYILSHLVLNAVLLFTTLAVFVFSKFLNTFVISTNLPNVFNLCKFVYLKNKVKGN